MWLQFNQTHEHSHTNARTRIIGRQKKVPKKKKFFFCFWNQIHSWPKMNRQHKMCKGLLYWIVLPQIEWIVLVEKKNCAWCVARMIHICCNRSSFIKRTAANEQKIKLRKKTSSAIIKISSSFMWSTAYVQCIWLARVCVCFRLVFVFIDLFNINPERRRTQEVGKEGKNRQMARSHHWIVFPLFCLSLNTKPIGYDVCSVGACFLFVVFVFQTSHLCDWFFSLAYTTALSNVYKKKCNSSLVGFEKDTSIYIENSPRNR